MTSNMTSKMTKDRTSDMPKPISLCLQLLLRVLSLLVLAGLFRLYFAIANQETYAVENLWDIARTFVFALRFDLSALLVFNGLIFLIWLWLLEWHAPLRIWQLWRLVYSFTNLGLIAASFVDLQLFLIHGQRQSVLHVPVAAEYVQQPLALVRSFGSQFLLFGIFAIVFFAIESRLGRGEKIWLRSPRRRRISVRILRTALITIGLAGIAVVGVRGGLQGKPLGIANAGDIGSDRLANLALSAPYMMTRWRTAQIASDHYFNSPPELLEALDPEKMGAANSGVLKGQNVVLIVMESFGREYMGWKNPWKGYTPFLDSLAERSTGFYNGFANGKNSIEFPPAILAGIPGWQAETYIRSTYATNSIHSLAEYFKSAGYRTAFFHGVGNGTMHFDSFMRLIGIEKYFGLKEYPAELKASSFDGTWGIFDAPYFQYFVDHINQDWKDSKQPFFYTVFSVSSHHPYKLPPQLASHYTRGEHPMHNVVAYADDSLEQFFTDAEKQPWFKNTLFVITGDHTSVSLKPEYMTPIGRFRVPIIFYDPGKKLPPADTSRLAQHMDISVSLEDLLDLPARQRTPLGRSLFRDNHPVAVNYHDGSFWIAEGEFVLVREVDGVDRLYNTAKDPLFKQIVLDQPKVATHLARRLNAHLQMYHNGLIDNSFFNWSRPTNASN